MVDLAATVADLAAMVVDLAGMVEDLATVVVPASALEVSAVTAATVEAAPVSALVWVWEAAAWAFTEEWVSAPADFKAALAWASAV